MTATQEYFATKLKLWTGMFLMFYCVTHHMNHSLGIFGLTVVDYAREYFLLFWRNPVISFFLLFTLVIHIIFSLLRVIKMASFKGFQSHEWFQLITGILTVPLLAIHITTTGIAHRFYGVEDTYTFWTSPGLDYFEIFFFNFIMLFIWLHGYIGIKFWMKVNSNYQKYLRQADIFFLIIPLLSIVGQISIFRESDLKGFFDTEYKEKILKYSNPENVDLNVLLENTIIYFVLP